MTFFVSILALLLCVPSWLFPYGTRRIAINVERPVFLAAPPQDSTRLFILEQYTGRILILKADQFLAAPFMDMSSKIEIGGNEQGLLGLAFHPRYHENGYFYLNYSRKRDGATIISRFEVSADPDAANLASEKILLTVDQPYSNHNGGHLEFGPDGKLWIGLGDGGSAGDPKNNAQNEQSMLGKMLILDVDLLNSTPQIWATGLRNPWRYCFDGDDIYIADVGQNKWEEVNVVPWRSRNLNFGWRLMEGKHCYDPPEHCERGKTLVYPAWEFDHDVGCSITGGYVYRGAAIPELTGHYFFTDYCAHKIWSFRYRSGGITEFTDHTVRLLPTDGSEIKNISSFGRDAFGELYILDHLGGEIFKVVP